MVTFAFKMQIANFIVDKFLVSKDENNTLVKTTRRHQRFDNIFRKRGLEVNVERATESPIRRLLCERRDSLGSCNAIPLLWRVRVSPQLKQMPAWHLYKSAIARCSQRNETCKGTAEDNGLLSMGGGRSNSPGGTGVEHIPVAWATKLQCTGKQVNV